MVEVTLLYGEADGKSGCTDGDATGTAAAVASLSCMKVII
jgi:hypothetical protein